MKLLVFVAGCLLGLFCTFGFVATFEPLDESTQTLWRAIHGVGVLAALAGIVWGVSSFARKGT